MSRTIFRKLENAYKAVYIELKNEEKKKEHKDVLRVGELQKQKGLLQDILNYVNSFCWLKHEETIERIKFFLKNKYSYSEFCNYFGVTYEAAKVCISYANQKCVEKIGKNTIDLILEGKIDEARATFLFRSGQLKLRNFIIDAALIGIPEAAYMTVDIEDCERELSFLRLYSQAILEARVELLDKEKMAYIRYILEGDNPKLAEERLHLLNLLQGRITVKEYIKEVKERNTY